MKVKMLKAVTGKVNGVQMGPYFVGHEYDLDRDRAELFIGSSMAEEIVEKENEWTMFTIPAVEQDPDGSDDDAG